MPTFDTPKPIIATVGFESGTLRVIAGDVAETVVDVRPSSESRDEDVKGAERTRVEFANGALLVKGPKNRSPFSKGSSIDVHVTLPAGSEVRVDTAMSHVVTEGRLGDCDIKTSVGDLQIEQAAAVQLNTGYGEVSLGRASGSAQVTTGSGGIRLGEVKGAVTVKNSNGATDIGVVGGDLTARGANGSVTVERAEADVTLKSANGSLRVGELARGTAVLETAVGSIEVGIRQSTATFLDVRTKAGSVRQPLAESEAPAESADTLKVRARTAMGDITIRRA
ncbi:hypothetical protein DMA15_26715 [Streptomyces sp. WAC 01529]|uniref:DUF4097 family beta strand repeat-containing protein n=1 Tax=Streptomyces sp. WAC 01529 TaxID=2203205 RepID=UPI000F6C737B|nr:DUF4097 family beta strand repeat-containing protein [Streptomyces sp. WAC 01529]AZM55735.1 hypothetical protein DMA15_26715 [Streptomyces sp. WAC 01529]